ncbi:MAG: alanine racemase [Nitrospirae bacterium]|nr:alanine racemase [Nitrospirota bacterium]MBI3377460.1 alanine racemase [Nitrospirota bacterium]
MERGPIAEIDFSAIAHNFKTAKKITGTGTVIAVVKADGYGHGAVEVSRRLVKEGASYLAVAYTSEAIALRRAGIKAPIIILFDKNNIEDYFKYNLIPVVHDVKTAQRFSKEAKAGKHNINLHIKVDTGMGRLGFNMEDVEKEMSAIGKMNFISVRGLMSHFSDADLSDRSYALMQVERFNKAKSILSKKGIKRILCHMANSAAVMTLPESYFDAVRPGLMLYGYSPIQSSVKNSELKTLNSKLIPSMTVKTNILSIRRFKKGTPVSYGRTFITARESLIAVLPVGYADGYPRVLSNNADVIIRGKRAPVAGRICMDTTMADVTEIGDVSEGDEVVLLGRHKNTAVTAFELAERARTIPYEILTSLGNKSRRVYING